MQVAVFHPGTQHSWQTALALQQLDRLAWYATSIFYQPDRFPYRLERLAPGRMGARLHAEFRRFSHPALDPRLVRTAGIAEWLERLAARGGYKQLAHRLDRLGNRRFVARLARDLCSEEPFALWGYNSSSLESFQLARQHGRICILDRTNAEFTVFNRLMAGLQDRYGDWFLPDEISIPAATIARDHLEYAAADRIVVGSPFAAETIRDTMRDPAIDAKLSVLNYCFDEALFASAPAPRPLAPGEPVKFLFLGLVQPRKGIQHVLEAFARLPRGAAELTIVGAMRLPPKAFAPYADRVTYIPTVARADVPAIMAAHHVFLLPSYFEGSSLSLLEALASGMAIIQTPSSGNGVTPETGLLIDRPDTELVLAAMEEAITNRPRLDHWRQHAQAEAANYSFARYRDNIAALLAELGL